MINVISVCADGHILADSDSLGRTGENNATMLEFEFFDKLGGKIVSDFEKELVALFPEGEKAFSITDNEFYIPSELTQQTELVLRVDLKNGNDVLFRSEPKLFVFTDSDIIPPDPQDKHPLIGDINKLKTKNKKNLVGAINEVFEGGGRPEDDPSGNIPEIDLSNYVTKDMLSKVNADDVIERLSGTVNVYKPITEGWIENAGISSVTGEVKVSESLYRNNVVTPLIPVVQDTLYSFTGQNDGMIYCYKENGEYIGYSLLTGVIDMNSASTFYHHGQTLPLTTYIRFVTNLNTDLETTMDEFNSTFMLCKGVGVPSEYVGFDEGGYLFKDNVYLSDKRVTEIAEKAALMLDEALSELLGSGEVEEDA